MIVKLLAKHHLESLSLKGGCRGSSESTHVKMSHCWKSLAMAHISNACNCKFRLFFCKRFYLCGCAKFCEKNPLEMAKLLCRLLMYTACLTINDIHEIKFSRNCLN